MSTVKRVSTRERRETRGPWPGDKREEALSSLPASYTILAVQSVLLVLCGSDGFKMQRSLCTWWCTGRDSLRPSGGSDCCVDTLGVIATLLSSLLLAVIVKFVPEKKRIRLE